MEELNGRTKYFSQLDGLRFIAILAVMQCHWIRTPLPATGFSGVNLFYVISGFLITRILLMSKEDNKGLGISLKRFYIRRTLRIFPIYYLSILVLFILNIPGARQDIYWLITYTFNIKLVLLNAYVHGENYGFYAHFWSLCVEEQFYFLFPILILLIPKAYMKRFLIGVICIGFFTRFFLMFQSNRSFETGLLPDCLDSFGLGALLAFYILNEPEALKKIMMNNLIFIISMISYIALVVIDYECFSIFNPVYCLLDRFLFSLCCFWIVGKASLGMHKGLMKGFLENKAVVYLGKISYGIYVYHVFVEEFLNHALYPIYRKCPVFLQYYWRVLIKYGPDNNSNWVYRFLGYSIVTVIVASISWYVIEKPIIKLKDKYAK